MRLAYNGFSINLVLTKDQVIWTSLWTPSPLWLPRIVGGAHPLECIQLQVTENPSTNDFNFLCNPLKFLFMIQRQLWHCPSPIPHKTMSKVRKGSVTLWGSFLKKIPLQGPQEWEAHIRLIVQHFDKCPSQITYQMEFAMTGLNNPSLSPLTLGRVPLSRKKWQKNYSIPNMMTAAGCIGKLSGVTPKNSKGAQLLSFLPLSLLILPIWEDEC